MLRNEVITTLFEKSEKCVIILNVSLKNFLKSRERNLLIDADLVKLLLRELREVGLDINHAV